MYQLPLFQLMMLHDGSIFKCLPGLTVLGRYYIAPIRISYYEGGRLFFKAAKDRIHFDEVGVDKD